MSMTTSKDGTRYFWDKNRLTRAEDSDGRIRCYSYEPKAHLEYIRLKNGEEWFSMNGRSAKP